MAEQVVNTVDLSTMNDQPALFTAGNRKINLIDLENSMSQYIDSFILTYLNSWGALNTQEVKLAYSNIINAIHSGKVSMNVDGSLQINDGSIVNAPNKSGFDANAAIAYFVKKVSDTVPDYKSPLNQKSDKKYTGNTFRGNFLRSLTPDIDSIDDKWYVTNWLGLDSEVTDALGNRSRPYTNRLKVFNEFLKKEIENLDNYGSVGEEYGDLETVKNRMLDALLRLADGEISAEDRLALTRLGFDPSMFTTVGTPKSEGEIALEAAAAEEQLKKEAELKAEEEAKAGALTPYKIGRVVNYTPEVNKLYSNFLALKYGGTGKLAFDAANAEIKDLLDRVYSGSSSQEERSQLAKLINYVRYNNPAYQNTTVTPEELNELKQYSDYKGGNVFRLPWTTNDGRLIYSDNDGTVYFLKPKNNVLLASNIQQTPNDYKENFLGDTQLGQLNAQQAKYAKESARKLLEDFLPEDLLELTALADDGIALVASFVPVYGTAIAAAASIRSLGLSTLADISKAVRGRIEAGEVFKNLGTNAALAALGLIPGGKSVGIGSKLAKFAKTLPKVVIGWLALGIISDPKPYLDSIAKLTDPKSMTVLDWNNIKHLTATAAGTAMTGRHMVQTKRYNNNRLYEVKTSLKVGETTKEGTLTITRKLALEIHKAGVEKGKAAADLKLQEIVKKNKGEAEAKDLILNEKTKYAEKPSIWSRGYQSLKRLRESTVGRPTEQYSEAFMKKERADILPVINRGGLNTDYNIYARGEKPILFKSSKKETTPETTQELATELTTEQKPAQMVYPEAPESWRNTFDNNNFTKSMLRHYDLVKSGLTPEEIAIMDDIKAKWNTATQLLRQLFADMIYKGKLQQLEKTKLRAENQGVEEEEKEFVGKSGHPLDRVPKGDKVLDTLNYSRRSGKFFYFVKHNGKTMIYDALSETYYKLEEANGLELTPAGRAKAKSELTLLHKFGGILKAAKGILINPNTSWYSEVFNPYQQYILQQLKANRNYAGWLNNMLASHAKLHTLAGQDFLHTAYSDPSVGTYLNDYLNDPQATGNKLELGYNYGISNAFKSSRYIREGQRTGLDWLTTGFVPDNLYSGETDDRRILGRNLDGINDWTDDNLTAWNNQLKAYNLHMFLDPADNYYKLGELDTNGNPLVDSNGVPIVFTGTSTNPTNNLANPGNNLVNPNNPSLVNPNNPSSVNPAIPSTATPPLRGSVAGSRVVGDVLGSLVGPKDNTLLPKMLSQGLGLTSILGHIATTNSNYKTAVGALRQLRLLDAPLKYHQVVGDYAGNQFAANLAAGLRNRANTPASSDKSFNAAKQLEAENRALLILELLAVKDQQVRQQHANIAEQYGNENRAARIDVGNKNGLLMYDMTNKLANLKQLKNLANWTSINNWLMEQRFKNDQEIDKKLAILENWKANRLGSRNSWIKNKMLMDPEYIRLMSEYETVNSDPKSTQDEKIAVVNKIRLKQSLILLRAGREWDLEYAKLYGLPYYDYNNLFEQELALAQRYNTKPTTSTTTTRTPSFSKGGVVDAYVQALKSSTSRKNSMDVTEREYLRARRADADRFMKSIWKQIDLYIHQSKNLNKK